MRSKGIIIITLAMALLCSGYALLLTGRKHDPPVIQDWQKYFSLFSASGHSCTSSKLK